jgi:V8-like Glu-specific endopeptidase
MISPTVMLTAAHYLATIGTMDISGYMHWLRQLQICIRDAQRTTPSARNPTDMDCEPNGGILATWSKMTTFVKWARDADRDWDIGWITLSSPVGFTSGWKGIRTAGFGAGVLLNVAGYSGGCFFIGDCSDNLKTMSCEIELDPGCVASSSRPNRYYFECDTVGGMSGSGVQRSCPSKTMQRFRAPESQ